ncbi:MAG: DUF6291 domain-containing protein [Eubacteriales bacterium]
MEHREYDNFIFFGSIRGSLDALQDECQQKKLLWAVIRYGTEGVIEETDPLILAVMAAIIPNLDNAKLRYSINQVKKINAIKADLGETAYNQVREINKSKFKDRQAGQIAIDAPQLKPLQMTEEELEERYSKYRCNRHAGTYPQEDKL